MANQPQIPSLLSAQTLLGKIVAVTRRSGDLGREFVLRGVERLVGRALDEQRVCAAKAHVIATEIESVDQAIAAALTDPETPGEITPAEAVVIRSKCRQAGRDAEGLAVALTVPAVAQETAV